jgi:transcriptional regulator with XRE-family HTH domain
MKEKNNFAQIYIAVRTSLGLTQSELAVKLSCTQSYLSKIEAGDCTPTVSNWVDFCLLFKVPVTAYKEGYLDQLNKVDTKAKLKLNKSQLKSIAQEEIDLELKVRFLIPYIELFIEKVGTKNWQKLISKYDLDSRYFYIRDHSIDPSLLLEIRNTLNQCGMQAAELSRLVQKYAGQEMVQGKLYKKYQSTKPQSSLTYFLNNIPQYFNLSRKDFSLVSESNCVKLIFNNSESSKLLKLLKTKSLSQSFLSYFEDYTSGTLNIGRVRIKFQEANNSHHSLIFSYS